MVKNDSSTGRSTATVIIRAHACAQSRSFLFSRKLKLSFWQRHIRQANSLWLKCKRSIAALPLKAASSQAEHFGASPSYECWLPRHAVSPILRFTVGAPPKPAYRLSGMHVGGFPQVSTQPLSRRHCIQTTVAAPPLPLHG